MSSEKAKNIFTPKNINSITIITTSHGIHKRISTSRLLYMCCHRQHSNLERCWRRDSIYFTIIIILQKHSLSHKLETVVSHLKLLQFINILGEIRRREKYWNIQQNILLFMSRNLEQVRHGSISRRGVKVD